MPDALLPAVATSAAVFAWFLVRRPPRDLLRAAGRRLPSRERVRLAEALDRAGVAVEPEFLLSAKYGGAALCLVGTLVALLSGRPALAVALGLAAAFSWVYPGRWLARLERARLEDLRREFPLMVTLLRVYARAADLYQALHIVRGALRGEMRRQLDLLVADLAVYPLPTALRRFAGRCRYPLITNFVAVVLFGITTGLDVDPILATFARRSYESRVNEIKRRIKAQPIILTVLPAAMLMALLVLFLVPMYTNIIARLRAF